MLSTMSIPPQRSERHAFSLMLAIAVVVGAFFRLWLIQSQVFIDDEWHSISVVMAKPLSWLLINFTVPNGFTSIPMNLYQWMLLETIGWSEQLLRMPSIVLGLLCLLLGPILCKGVVGTRRAAILGLLLAISPLLVFYGRLSRPYSAVVFFSFVSFLYAAQWMQSGKLRHAVGFAIGGVLAVYCQPFAAVAVATMGGSLFTESLLRPLRSKASNRNGPSRLQVVAVLLAMGLTGAILLLPALIHSMETSFLDVLQRGTIYLSSWTRLLSLISGTANPILAILFWVVFLMGVVDLYRRNPWLAFTFAAFFPLQVLALWITRPHSCDVGILLARYSMPLIPVTLLLVACGLQACLDLLAARLKLKSSLLGLLAFTFVAALALAGPLPGIYTAPNQFTNHGIFQHNYEKLDWSHSFVSDFLGPNFRIETSIRAEDLSDFYRVLREHPNQRPIVEYPMLIGDHFNPLYFYQWHHRRPILVGYARSPDAPRRLQAGGVYGNTYIDEVMNLIEDPGQLRFRNLIEMHDIEGMRAKGAEYVILHKRFEAEIWQVAPPPPALKTLMVQYRATLPLVHEDNAMVVFGLDP